MRMTSLLLLAGCAVEPDLHGGADSPTGQVPDDAPPPGTITLRADAITGGERTTFMVSGADPGSPTYVFLSLAGAGAGPCAPGGSPCLGILSPTRVGLSRATVDGDAWMSVAVPSTVPNGTPLRLQAAAMSGGAWVVSSVMQRTTGTGGDCWELETLLDVASGTGAGAAYADAELRGACTANFTITSNSMPFYTFIPMTPNALVESALTLALPRRPEVAASPTDIDLLGTVAVTVSGLPIFGPNEGPIPAQEAWGDPVYNGIVDGCAGHTAFAYHNHALEQVCLTDDALTTATPWTLPAPDPDLPSPIIGWARDGFPIYGPYGCIDAACSRVEELRSGYVQIADPTMDAWDAYQWQPDNDPTTLDACNGRIGPDGSYRYHATATFPYILGCFAGTPVAQPGGGGGPPRP